MSRAQWLALSSVSGIGAVTVRRLLERFGDVGSIFEASPEELTSIPRVTPELAERLRATPVEQLEEELLTLSDDGIDLLTWDDERFPTRLRGLADAPVILFMRGGLSANDDRAVAIVGTRAPGKRAAELALCLGREFAARGLTVVSGLAAGVDAAAHQGALAAEDGRTLAVLGSGIRVIHPQENEELAAQIVKHGALLSELHPNAPPRGPQLMARDRIISGLSRAVILIEAGAKSGSLDTAQRGIKQGRTVYAVPGSEGTEQLLAGGARRLDTLLQDFDRLAEEILAAGAPPADDVAWQGPLW